MDSTDGDSPTDEEAITGAESESYTPEIAVCLRGEKQSFLFPG